MLQYAIHGAFGYCPDCGADNCLQIVNANHDLAVRLLDLAKPAAADVVPKLVENALEKAVSCPIDEHCRIGEPLLLPLEGLY